MKGMTKKTYQILWYNAKNILIFEFLYRLIITPIYMQLISEGLKFALRRAGYSYLTVGNIGSFLMKPWTLILIIGCLFVGTLCLGIEIGALITVFEGAAYAQKLNPLDMLAGGMEKLCDEIGRRNWKLLVIALIEYTLTHFYLIGRVLSHVKPFNFVISEILANPMTRLLMLVVLAIFVCIALPTIFVFPGCMVEQKTFRDSVYHSKNLLGSNWFRPAFLLTVYNFFIIAGIVGVYLISVCFVAVFVELFVDQHLALSVLLSVCDKIELVLLLLSSVLVTVVNFATIMVLYLEKGKAHIVLEPSGSHSSAAFSHRRTYKWSKKKVAATVTAVTLASLLLLFDVVYNGSEIANDMLSEIQITAHRGGSKIAPENTMSAMKAAVEQLADYAEIDVQETKDGQVVVCHDINLKRLAGVDTTVAKLDFLDVRKLDVGSWFSKEFEGEQIPTLEEVLEFCKGKILLNIELKYVGKNSKLPEKVVELMEEHGMEEQCVVTSISLDYLAQVKEENPNIKTGYILAAAYGDYYASDSIDFISIRSGFINEKLMEAAHAHGKAVHAWTVNHRKEMERMKLLGVDNIITDNPVLTRETVYRQEAKATLLEYIRMVLR